MFVEAVVMKRGDLVTVIVYGDEHKQVRVWEVRDKGIMIHSEEEYQKRLRGELHLNPVGFLWELVVD